LIRFKSFDGYMWVGQISWLDRQRYWVVYNGAIYHHIELLAELEARGYQFVSKSDTEVIIHGYREWGRGLPPPVQRHVREVRRESPEAFCATLRVATEASSGVLSPKALDYLDEGIEGRRAFSFVPWRMIYFGAWMKCFDVQVDG
jgi:hypothetical protein